MNYGKSGIRNKQLQLNAKSPKWARKLLLIFLEVLLISVVGVAIIGCAFGIGMFKSILSSAPDISTITVTPSGRSSFVYDREGNQIAKLVSQNANRIPVTFEQIPVNLQHAFVAIEDERFYTHNGIDIKGIVRAGFTALKNRKFGQGASTITQQLLKNNVFTDWMQEENMIQKIKRKIQEQYLAVELEKVMTKDEILTNYLNTINLGNSTLGVQAASLRYFGKSCSDLTLSECAVIAAITQNPAKLNPITHPDKNAERRTDVLNYMLRDGYITRSDYDEAMEDNVYERISNYNTVQAETSITSYFVDALTDVLWDDMAEAGYNESQIYTLLYSGGLKIHATMDPTIQAIADEEFSDPENYPERVMWYLNLRITKQCADESLVNYSSEMFRSYWRKNHDANFNLLFKSEEAAYEAIEEYETSILEEGEEIYAESVTLTPQPQISFTLADQHTGEVLAMIGGRGKKEASRTYNRATQSMRQPGSCFKVLAAFAPAIDACGMTLATVYNDAPFNYYDGTPVSNWWGPEYKGLCSLRYGVYWSLNVVAVKTITQITPQLGYEYLKNFGFTTLEDSKVVGDQIYTDVGQPLALGGITNGILNIELNAAYASIANKGVYIEPKLYTYVEDSDGNIILDNRENNERRVLSEQTCFLLTDAMTDCVKIGTGTRAKFADMSIAGKTGTTSNAQDVWFAGFTPYYTASIWAGYDNNAELTDAEQRLPTVLFRAVMERVHENLPDPGFEIPEGIEKVTICSKSGKLPVPGLCDGCLREEYFTKETVPTDYCNVHYAGDVCALDGLPACPNCPFKYPGVLTLTPVEDESLWEGSTVVVEDPLNPLNVVTYQPVTTTYCHHTYEFMTQENIDDILAVESAQYYARFPQTEYYGE